MGDDDPLDAGRGQLFDPGPDGAIQPLAGLPHDGGSQCHGPVGHLGVVAHYGHWKRGTGGDDLFGHGANQEFSHLIAHRSAQPSLGLSESLDRDEHDLMPEGHSGWWGRHGG